MMEKLVKVNSSFSSNRREKSYELPTQECYYRKQIQNLKHLLLFYDSRTGLYNKIIDVSLKNRIRRKHSQKNERNFNPLLRRFGVNTFTHPAEEEDPRIDHVTTKDPFLPHQQMAAETVRLSQCGIGMR